MSTQDEGPALTSENSNTAIPTPVVAVDKQAPTAATTTNEAQVLPTTNEVAPAAPASTKNNVDPIVPLRSVGIIIECPHPIDVLMPVSGYQLWAGNRRYRTLVELLRPEFRQRNATEQARLALEIVRTIQREGGRFLQAVESPASPNETIKGIVRTTLWKILPETDVLVHLGEALRDERGQARKRHRQQRKERRQERRRLRRAARAAERAFVGNSTAVETDNTGNIWDAASMGALKSLYYVPGAATVATTTGSQYRPVTNTTRDGRDDDTLSSTSSSSSDVDSLPLPPPPKKSKTTGASRVKKGPPGTAAIRTKTDTMVHVQKKEPKVNFHYKAKPSRSSKAVMEQEGETELPKGVTVRPSGKWQAQTYFAGQSRYVGVYDTSRMAARAYVVVQDYLRMYRGNRSLTKDSPKEELARIFATARKAADEAVVELRKSEEATGNKTTTKVEAALTGNDTNAANT